MVGSKAYRYILSRLHCLVDIVWSAHHKRMRIFTAFFCVVMATAPVDTSMFSILDRKGHAVRSGRGQRAVLPMNQP